MRFDKAKCIYIYIVRRYLTNNFFAQNPYNTKTVIIIIYAFIIPFSIVVFIDLATFGKKTCTVNHYGS